MIDRGEKYRNWKKIIAGVLTVVMVLAMGISGTLAYLSGSPLSVKSVELVEGKAVMAHDDFYEVGGGSFNKDIYVENTGMAPVFVRVKLTEELTVGGTTLTPEGGVPHKLGEVPDCSDLTHSYFQWTMGNAAESTALSADDSAFTDTTRTDVRLVDSANLNDTNEVYVGQVAQDSSDEKKQDYAGVSDTARELLKIPSCEVISMAAYFGKTIPADFVGWVVDEDGWAYWTRQLAADEATGYLLNGVEKTAALGDQSYTYKINVTYEAVTVEDMGLWIDGSGTLKEGGQNGIEVSGVDAATDNALMLLRNTSWRDGDSTVTTKLDTALNGRMEKHIAEIEAKAPYGSAAAKRLYTKLKSSTNWNGTSWNYRILQVAEEIQKEIDALVEAGNRTDALALLKDDVSTQFSGNIKTGIIAALTKQEKTEPNTFTQDDLNSINDITFEQLTSAEVDTLAEYQDRLPNIGALRLCDLQVETLDVTRFPFTQAWWWNIVETKEKTGMLKRIGGTLNTLDFSQCKSIRGLHLELRGNTSLNLVLPAHLPHLSLSGNRVNSLDLRGLSKLEFLRIELIENEMEVNGWSALTNLRDFASSGNSVPIAVDLSVCRRLLMLQIRNTAVSELKLPTDANAFDDGVGEGGGYAIAFGGTISIRSMMLPTGISPSVITPNLETWKAAHPKAPPITYQ